MGDAWDSTTSLALRPNVPCYLLSMQVTVEIPDDMVRKLTQKGQDAARATLEALAIEGYRSGALTSHQTRRLLGFQTRYELDQVASILIGCCRMARALELRG